MFRIFRKNYKKCNHIIIENGIDQLAHKAKKDCKADATYFRNVFLGEK